MRARAAVRLLGTLAILAVMGCDGGSVVVDGCCGVDTVHVDGSLYNVDREATLEALRLTLDGRVIEASLSSASLHFPLRASASALQTTAGQHTFKLEMVRQTVPRASYVAMNLRARLVDENNRVVRQVDLPEKSGSLAPGDSLTWTFDL